jgi:hypothetical protein
MTLNRFHSAAKACWLVLALTLLGCGPGTGDLTGKITYQGKAVHSGSIIVKGSDGLLKDAKVDAEGAYSLKGIAAGEIEAIVTSPDPGIVPVVERKPHPLPVPGDRSKWFPIPLEYGDFSKSSLKYPLKPGANQWDIDLK